MRSWCTGSRSWPAGTTHPARDGNDVGYALCGACGKRAACTRTPTKWSAGVLRAHYRPQ